MKRRALRDKRSMGATDTIAERGDEQAALMRDIMRPLSKHYLRDDISEIAVNCPRLVFHRLRSPDRLGRVWRQVEDPDLTLSYLLTAMHTLAHIYGYSYDGNRVMTIYGTTPTADRLTAASGRGVQYDGNRPEGGIALSIRQSHLDKPTHSLEALGLTKGGAERADKIRSAVRDVYTCTDNATERLLEAARAGNGILLSGATNTGKTSTLNRLLEELDDDCRVISIEDARELKITIPNRLHLVTSRDEKSQKDSQVLSDSDVLNLLRRLSPEAIMLGEVSDLNAGIVCDTLRLGHSHCWTSIHASDPQTAREMLATMGHAAAPKHTVADNLDVIRKTMVVIQIKMHGKVRAIDEIVYPDPKEDEKAA